ncbi:unnamed protein product [Cylicocyclus nassatus]|uniref:Uncharacterized protein n=1 Tax=Cylicocyclus nassatus TaxID=53992 RepID=A0AA36MEU0_CYLNA|nr:unnamed protein product [Cylicocyclus nassatus]
MSDDLPQDIRRIIAAQTESTTSLPKSFTLPVLPKIGHSDSSSSPSKSDKVKSASSEDSIVLPPLTEGIRRMRVATPARSRPILNPTIAASDYELNYSSISDEAVLGSAASSGGGRFSTDISQNNNFDKTFVIRKDTPFSEDAISQVDLSFATIPDSLPDIPGLQNAVDNLSNRRLTNLLDACRLYDRELRGYLSVPSLTKCFGEVHAPSSPWRLFLQSLAPDGEFVEYEKLLELLNASRHNEHLGPTIPELIVSAVDDNVGSLFRPSTSQEDRERTRAQYQVMTEIEVALMRNPDLTLDRLKVATTQKVIEVSEFKMLLELYGLEPYFRHFYQRLVSCFLTHDDKFCFSAFTACLELVRPPLTQSAPLPPPTPLWTKPSLPVNIRVG